MRLAIAFAATQCVRTIVETLGQMAAGAHVIGVTRACAVHADTVAGTVALRIGGRAAVHRVRNVEAGHVVGVVTKEVQQHGTGVGYHLGYATNREVLPVH